MGENSLRTFICDVLEPLKQKLVYSDARFWPMKVIKSLSAVGLLLFLHQI